MGGMVFVFKYGLIFLLSALSKLWVSIYVTKYFLLRELEVMKEVEGTVYSNFDSLVLTVIIIEFVISLILISVSIFSRNWRK